MTTAQIIGIVVACILLLTVLYFFHIALAAYLVFTIVLKRRNKKKWGRAVSIRNKLKLQMDEEGLEWQKKHAAYKHDVHIVNDEGMNLYGEYYDLGYDKAVIILSGRTESLRYGYYFAKPYSEAGCNVLVIDSRAHGHSDGKYNTVGFEESKDDLAWARFLHTEFKVNSIIFHGICIGAAGGMYAITSPDCPDCVKGLVTEGMFANFGLSMKNHLLEYKALQFPIMQCIDFWSKRYIGHSMTKGPIDVISKMDKPLLMIQGKMDKYSTPDNAEKMFGLCPSTKKKLVMYDEGGHSMLRITDTEKYDTEIAIFLSQYFSTEKQAV